MTCKEAVGSKGSFGQLSIETGKLVFSNIGDKNRPGAEKLIIKASNIEFFGTVADANEQHWGEKSWGNTNLYLKSGQHTTFITREKPLMFAATTHLVLSPQTNIVFETQGGDFEFSKLSGNHHQFVTINTGHGQATIGEFEGNLGPLHVLSRGIHLGGKIDVGSIFLEAHENICYATDSYQPELLSKEKSRLMLSAGWSGPKNRLFLLNQKASFYLVQNLMLM